MLTSEAHIETDRASRYLLQLGRHADGMGRNLRHRPRTHGGSDAPPEVQHVECSDTHGIVKFGWGQCTMDATQDGLTLRAEAADEEDLRRIQDGIARRLETIGTRDQLKVTWQPTQFSAAQSAPAKNAAPANPGKATTHRAHRSRIGLIAVAALAIAVHLGLLGAALKSSRWTGAASIIVLAVVLVKLVIVPLKVIGLHHLATRRSKASKSP